MTWLSPLFWTDLIEDEMEQVHSSWCTKYKGSGKCDCGLERVQSIVKNAPKAKGKQKSQGMSRPEKRYAERLHGLQAIGAIHWYAFEAIKLRLADATTYTPDFLVLTKDGFLECHEVKGGTMVKLKAGPASRPWCEEDAKIKIKVAAEMYPFRFVMAWEDKQCNWHFRDYSESEVEA